mgnify:CR=1 FL=1
MKNIISANYSHFFNLLKPNIPNDLLTASQTRKCISAFLLLNEMQNCFVLHWQVCAWRNGKQIWIETSKPAVFHQCNLRSLIISVPIMKKLLQVENNDATRSPHSKMLQRNNLLTVTHKNYSIVQFKVCCDMAIVSPLTHTIMATHPWSNTNAQQYTVPLWKVNQSIELRIHKSNLSMMSEKTDGLVCTRSHSLRTFRIEGRCSIVAYGWTLLRVVACGCVRMRLNAWEWVR